VWRGAGEGAKTTGRGLRVKKKRGGGGLPRGGFGYRRQQTTHNPEGGGARGKKGKKREPSHFEKGPWVHLETDKDEGRPKRPPESQGGKTKGGGGVGGRDRVMRDPARNHVKKKGGGERIKD